MLLLQLEDDFDDTQKRCCADESKPEKHPELIIGSSAPAMATSV